MPLEVLVRFGRWDEILAEPNKYGEQMPFTRAFHHAARAIAYAAKGDVANAKKEQNIYLERAKLVPKEDFLGNNSCEAILGVVTPMLEGEIFVAEGFREEFNGPGFHGAHRHRYVTVTGNENNWNLSIAIGQFLLQVKTTQSR